VLNIEWRKLTVDCEYILTESIALSTRRNFPFVTVQMETTMDPLVSRGLACNLVERGEELYVDNGKLKK